MKTRFLITVLIVFPITLKVFSQSNTNNGFDEYLKQLMFLEGEIAPDFELVDTVDNMVKLSDFTEKLVVLDFWGTFCKPCINDFPFFKEVQNEFEDITNIQFVSICIDKVSNKPRWKELIKTHKLKGTQLFLGTDIQYENQANGYYMEKIELFPTYLLVSKQGVFLGQLPDPDSGIMSMIILKGLKGETTASSVGKLITDHE